MGLIYPLDFDTYDLASMTRSSRGLGHWPFTPATRVRIPYGSPYFFKSAFHDYSIFLRNVALSLVMRLIFSASILASVRYGIPILGFDRNFS